jgi:hypothetical protein
MCRRAKVARAKEGRAKVASRQVRRRGGEGEQQGVTTSLSFPLCCTSLAHPLTLAPLM